jgi:hypothetical protein
MSFRPARKNSNSIGSNLDSNPVFRKKEVGLNFSGEKKSSRYTMKAPPPDDS